MRGSFIPSPARGARWLNVWARPSFLTPPAAYEILVNDVSMPDPEQALRERANARIGRVLREKWRVDRLLGLGGMAAVYAATHVNNGRRVAIKLLHPELSTNTEVRTRFQREGYVANKLEHPGAVGVLDDDTTEDGAAFLVMELLEGETLEDRRERSGVLPVHEVLSLADRLLDVLASAHAKGIVHRDIKPENVFLTREGTVKVLDFGIARMRELQSARLTMTSAGAIGTPAFMPPEQARGRWDEVGPQSDIWAVGATMFTLLAGRLVHNADTVNELMLAAMTKPAPPMGTAMPGISPVVAHLVDRALAYDVKARWPDARAMQSALRAAYQSLSATPPARAPQASWANIADPASVSGAYPAMPPQPMTVPMMSSAQSAPRPMMASSLGAPMMATGNPVTMVGGPPARKGQGAALAIVGAVAGMLVVGTLLFLVVLRKPTTAGGSDGASSASASATVAATASPSAEPSATASAAPSAAPTASASATPAVDAPTATPSATAAASSKPSTPSQPNKPGKFLRNPNVKHK